ncbi:MAG: hypothetical protein RLZZ142_1849 [Verrucomicrobiota bacterium]
MKIPLPFLFPGTLLLASLAMLSPTVFGVNSPLPPPNYDESRVGSFTLPEALRMADGSPVETAQDWTRRRRPELLELYRQHVYGRTPQIQGPLEFRELDSREDALGGTAVRKRVWITLKDRPAWKGLEVLLYVPRKRLGPVPCFVGLNFMGNHSTTRETDLPISSQWLEFRAQSGTPPRKGEPESPESSRGFQHGRWNPEAIVGAGCAVATAYYGDLELDLPTGWTHGVRAALSPQGAQTEWKPDDWGAIGAWAWGLSRILDFLGTVPEVDSQKCAVIGHSRLGKAALWAGAQDERFSVVISNNSGEGGAALMRRQFGETVEVITARFPHWFAPRFKQYARNEDACPVDQHLLIALCAPRPVAIGSAEEDRWADPTGEFLSGYHAGPVYGLFGKQGLASSEKPSVGTGATGDTISYHLRPGPHDINAEDWKEYLRFCKRHWNLQE